MVVLSIYLYWAHRRDLKVFLGSKSVVEVYNISSKYHSLLYIHTVYTSIVTK